MNTILCGPQSRYRPIWKEQIFYPCRHSNPDHARRSPVTILTKPARLKNFDCLAVNWTCPTFRRKVAPSFLRLAFLKIKACHSFETSGRVQFPRRQRRVPARQNRQHQRYGKCKSRIQKLAFLFQCQPIRVCPRLVSFLHVYACVLFMFVLRRCYYLRL